MRKVGRYYQPTSAHPPSQHVGTSFHIYLCTTSHLAAERPVPCIMSATVVMKTLTATDQESLLTFSSTSVPGTVVNASLNGSGDSLPSLILRLTVAGFIDIKPAIDSTDSVLTARLPDYAAGTSVSLANRPHPWPSTSGTHASQFALALSSDGSGVPAVDEADLLASDRVKSDGPLGCAPASDGTGKRKPCKNCSCGLKDIDGDSDEDGAVKAALATNGDGVVDTISAAKSGCGSCSLGDAFRCAGCPYLGLPPFKPGEKVALPTSLMTSDI